MVILYSSLAAQVKTPRPFGLGILRSLPSYRADYTASDALWLAQESNRREDARFDAMAAESAAQDRLEAGLCG